MYIDTDTGTILNGPIVRVEWKHFNNFFQGEDSPPDSEVIEYALAYGEPVRTDG